LNNVNSTPNNTSLAKSRGHFICSSSILSKIDLFVTFLIRYEYTYKFRKKIWWTCKITHLSRVSNLEAFSC